MSLLIFVTKYLGGWSAGYLVSRIVGRSGSWSVQHYRQAAAVVTVAAIIAVTVEIVEIGKPHRPVEINRLDRNLNFRWWSKHIKEKLRTQWCSDFFVFPAAWPFRVNS